MTFPTTCRIFACLSLNHLDNKYDCSFQQFNENQSRIDQRQIRNLYQLQHIATSDSGLGVFKKTTSVPTPTKNIQLQLPSLILQPWLKIKQLM